MDEEAFLPGTLATWSAVLRRGPSGRPEEDVTVGGGLRGVVSLWRALHVHWHEVGQSLGHIAATRVFLESVTALGPGWGAVGWGSFTRY